ncbi:NERD domain-containing protein [Microbacterium sp. NPDC003461]
MARMIPARPRSGANGSERRVFDAFAGARGIDDWVVIHGLQIRRHVGQFQGEADFIVIVPGRGIVVIEAKSPEYVEYRDGEWTLDRVPNPGKSPFDQVDGAIRSLRGFLKSRELLVGAEPIARLVWFTSLGRHLFENRSPGDMQFFEWELAFRDDLRDPVALVERVLGEHDAWYAAVEGVEHDPSVMTAEHSDAIARALVGDFAGGRTAADRKLERRDDEEKLLKSQRVILDAVARNGRLCFEGPAGTGKSYLLTSLAKSWAAEGARTLLTCWNVLMADELVAAGRNRPTLEAMSLNALMLRMAGVEKNPDDASRGWYEQELPKRALERLRADPSLGGYDAICVDEFQDVAGFPDVIALLRELADPSAGSAPARVAVAADPRQQILRPAETHADPWAVASEAFPGMVHVAMRQSVRQVRALSSAAEELLGRRFGYTGHRLVSNDVGGMRVVRVGDSPTSALAGTLRDLLQQHPAHDIVVLSPFGERRSLVGRMLASPHFTKDEKWLRAQLRHVGDAPDDARPKGAVRWGSIGKFKGLDAEAVILTDIGDDGLAFAKETGLPWFDLLYVGLTRAKYRCVVLPN